MNDNIAPTPDIERAQQRINMMLLGEVVHSLLARGALHTEDVAGALLRTIERAKSADETNEEAGALMPNLAVIAEATTEEWDAALGLAPDLYTLRKLHLEWKASGRLEKSPFHPNRVVEYYRQDE